MKTETKSVTRIPAHLAKTRLERHVLTWLNDADGYDDGATGRLADLMHGGGQSGMISHLIYSADCRAFLKRHREEINGLLGLLLQEHGLHSAHELIRDWDAEDPLGISLNADRLAWFGFEETAHKLGQEAGIDV